MSDTANTFTLSDLKDATKRRMGPTVFVLGDDDEVSLPSVFRIGKKDREAIIKAMEELDGLDEPTDSEDDVATAELLIEAISNILRMITPDAERLLAAIEDEDPLVTASLLGEVLGKWMKHTQAGEA